ncbi:hypothetical protein CSOJ01_01774 [Colletotrichum sojae]|uniref:Uncharacterized protein n=1 Tax=Colletotrichum sojae TaxID=2175907 RepID=A0A8H6JSM9_9PEZI|nr:hypothetical protein CSOJ01_01774 [Colletotrichum sojae]
MSCRRAAAVVFTRVTGLPPVFRLVNHIPYAFADQARQATPQRTSGFLEVAQGPKGLVYLEGAPSGPRASSRESEKGTNWPRSGHEDRWEGRGKVMGTGIRPGYRVLALTAEAWDHSQHGRVPSVLSAAPQLGMPFGSKWALADEPRDPLPSPLELFGGL